MTEQINPKQLEWQCRRGMLELDVILIPFLKEHFSSLNQQQKETFAEFLKEPDPDLYTWLMGFGQCENEMLLDIIKCIRTKMGISS